jgi:hypothetical protein
MAGNPDPEFLKRLSMVVELAGGVGPLATQAGISISGLRKYLVGSEPTRLVLASLSKAAGVRVGWLVTGEGPICKDDSVVMQKARHLIGLAANKVCGNPEYHSGGLVGALQRYADEYNSDSERVAVPDWVHLAVPTANFEEVGKWRLGNLNYRTPSKGTLDLAEQAGLIAPVAAKVAAAIRRALGEGTASLAPEKEAYLFQAGLKFCELVSVNSDEPEVELAKVIEYATFEFDTLGRRS